MQKLIRNLYLIERIIFTQIFQGYQISQYKDPIVGEGTVVLDLPSGPKTRNWKTSLEQDAGKVFMT